MICPDCGHVEQCKDCSIALTYHRTDGFLKCHLCGYRKPSPMVCPSCQSLNIRKRARNPAYRGFGFLLDAEESESGSGGCGYGLSENALRSTLRDFRKGRIGVLVGTQMIAKGLDFPNATLVGVIDADLPLRMEDFRASERAFQLLVQVTQEGLGEETGRVRYAFQSYAPHSPSIQFARKSDLRGFVEEEMEMRKELGYPPFRSLIRHLFRGRSSEKTEFAQQWARALRENPIEGLTVRGPAAAPLEKMKGLYRHHLFYFTNEVTRVVRELEIKRNAFPWIERCMTFWTPTPRTFTSGSSKSQHLFQGFRMGTRRATPPLWFRTRRMPEPAGTVKSFEGDRPAPIRFQPPE